MSGFAGLLRRDGAPVTDAELNAMLAALTRRGPDAQRTWIAGSVGLAHAALFTSAEAEREHQPCTLDGQVWIAADARIDHWADLRRQLATAGETVPADVTDAGLILHAYRAWDEACVEHLIGDFAFVIWDARRGRLFCARDHTGIRPFYYHLTDELFAFASDVGALLALTAVPKTLNEGRIADYLVGHLEGIDRTSTFYDAIRRLPPATCRTIDRDRQRDWMYWWLDPSRKLTFKTDAEAAEAFLDVFTEAVRCRLRDPARVGSMLSGGIDSSTVVAVAARLLRTAGQPPLPTFSALSRDDNDIETQVIKAALGIDHLAPTLLHPDEYAGLADELDILNRECHDLFDTQMPIPQAMYILAARRGLKAMFDGVAGDLVVTLGGNHLTYLLRHGQLFEAVAEARGLARLYHRWNESARKRLITHAKQAFAPRWWTAKRVAQRRDQTVEAERVKALLNPDFARRIDLAGRLDAFTANNAHHPRTQREDHVRRLEITYLTIGLERYDRVAARYGLEALHPYHDRHLVEFCVALDWRHKDYRGWSKALNRQALAGLAPEAVRWATPRPNLSPPFWQARSAAFRARLPDLNTPDFLDALAPYLDVAQARAAITPYLDGASSDEGGLWKYHALARWLRDRA